MATHFPGFLRPRLGLLLSAGILAGTLALSACDNRGGAQPAESSRPAQPSQSAPADNPAVADAPLKPDQVQAVVQTLQSAPQQGFATGAFGDVQQMAALAGSNDPAEQARGQAELRKAIIGYARAQHGLGLPTDQFPKEWGIRPPPYDARAELRAALAHDSLSGWLKSLPPPSPRYAALVQALAAYQNLAARGGWNTVPQGSPLRQGGSGARVRALRARLAVEDPVLASQPPSNRFDAALAAALVRFQLRYGLKDAGFVGPETYAALNTPIEARIDQIRANLQRWRWVPRDPPPTRIEVDAASGAMDYYKDGSDVMHMLAVAGKPDDKTPLLISNITDVVLNPAWHVPADIALKEIYPKERRDHGYFAREGFEKGLSSIAPVIQKPGPKNALGQVKFEFDNAYGVYMHDTPGKTAFNLAQRSVSHGCVRLQHALDLAKALLSSSPGWSSQSIDQAVAGGDTQTITLPRPIPVYLLYWTAYVQNGQVILRQDPYGWDAILVRLLDAPSSSQG